MKAIRNKPDYVDAWTSLTNVYLKLNRFSDAQKSLGEALRLDPKNKMALEVQNKIQEKKPQPAARAH